MNWFPSETCVGGEMAEEQGYALATQPPTEESPEWFWKVEVTAAISEWPEIVSCGFAKTAAQAKFDAEDCVARAMARRVRA